MDELEKVIEKIVDEVCEEGRPCYGSYLAERIAQAVRGAGYVKLSEVSIRIGAKTYRIHDNGMSYAEVRQ